MDESRLTRRDQAVLPQPVRACLRASSGGAREKHVARETTATDTSFFALLSHIAPTTKGAFHTKRVTGTVARRRGTGCGAGTRTL